MVYRLCFFFSKISNYFMAACQLTRTFLAGENILITYVKKTEHLAKKIRKREACLNFTVFLFSFYHIGAMWFTVSRFRILAWIYAKKYTFYK